MTQRKHILLLSSWYPSRVDPHSGNFVKRFAELLAREHEVTVIFTRSEARSNIEIVETKDAFHSIFVYHPEGKNTIDKFLQQKKVIREGFKYVQEPVDLIFGHIIWPKGLQFIEAQKHFKAPLLLLEHASYYRPGYQLGLLQRMVIRRCLGKATVVGAVSEGLRKNIADRFRCNDIVLIPNPVDENSFYLQERPAKRTFIHISTLDPAVKNVDRILRALHLLHNEGIAATLLIVSDQPSNHLKTLCKELKIEEAVEFTGPLTGNQIAEELQQSQALIVSSSYETFGIVIAESWLCGKPVISTPVGIASEMNKSAGIVTGFDAEDIALGMKQFLSNETTFDPQLIAAFGQPFIAQNVLKLLNEHISRLTGSATNCG